MLASASSISPEFVALCVVAAVGLANYLGLLDRLGLKNRSAGEAAAELAIREATIERLRTERNRAITTVSRLEQERSNAPVLELIAKVADVLAQVAETCDGTFSKLASFNGTLDHMRDEMAANRDALLLATEGMKALTGTICELHDLPLKEPRT